MHHLGYSVDNYVLMHSLYSYSVDNSESRCLPVVREDTYLRTLVFIIGASLPYIPAL